MTITEQFNHILDKEQGKEIIPFLKTLDKAQKKELVPVLKKHYKYYSEFVQINGGSSYSARWSDPKRKIIGLASFVCYNQKDFEQNNTGGIIEKTVLDTLLPWYCPDWFDSYINGSADKGFTPYYLKYDWYMELVERGFIKERPELIASILPGYMMETRNRKYEYVPENLLKREITLNEHIWHLFESETSINSCDRYMNVPGKTKTGIWIDILKTHAGSGRIDRQRLLSESLKASNKNFNQPLSGWFVDLFDALEPTKQELLKLQPMLFAILNSPHSKPINTSLKYLKELATDPDFSVEDFLDNAPMLLTAESKSIVSSALMVLDKLAKLYPDKREQITAIACQAFIHQDDGLQTRAAKLLLKYGEATSEELKETVATYYDALLFEARNLLAPFAEQQEQINQIQNDDQTPDTEELIAIHLPRTFDELVFLASQALDQNEAYHFDLLPAALLRFQNEMTAGNIVKLAPAFQRAYKLIMSDFTSTMGYLDNMLAKFLVEYGQLLAKFYPQEAKPISDLHDSFIKKESENKAQWSWYTARISGIKSWSVFTKSTGYKMHKHLLLNAFFMLERKINLPMLSTPTHEPCWVSPVALVERLVLYRNAKVIPADMDFQIAVSRCAKDGRDEALQLANAKLTGEYRQLISFVFGEEHHPQESFTLKPVWLVAAATRFGAALNDEWLAFTNLKQEYLTGNFDWQAKIEHFTYKNWDYNLQKQVDAQGKHSKIRVLFGSHLKKPSVIKNFFAKILPVTKEQPESIYDLITIKYEYVSAEQNDVKRFIYLNPNQPDVWLAHVISKGLNSPDFTSENEKKIVLYALEALLALNTVYGTMAHLLIAGCMVSNDKTVRAYAAELWIKGVNDGSISSKQLGNIIGQFAAAELTPMKRFTDLMMANMLQVSKKHTIALEELLNALIAQMADKPANSPKKLLEVYTEVLSANNTKALPEVVLNKINAWQTTDAIEKTVLKVKKVAGVS